MSNSGRLIKRKKFWRLGRGVIIHQEGKTEGIDSNSIANKCGKYFDCSRIILGGLENQSPEKRPPIILLNRVVE